MIETMLEVQNPSRILGQRHYVDVSPPAVVPERRIEDDLAIARLERSYVIAQRSRRNPEEAKRKIINACKILEFAKEVEYAKPIGSKTVKGFSIRFIEFALTQWGNTYCSTSVAQEDDNQKVLKVTIIDLESNFVIERECRIKKTIERKNSSGREIISQKRNSRGETIYSVRATEDELREKENSQISRIIRNEGGRIIPVEIKFLARHTAIQTMRGEDPETAKGKIVEAFASIDIDSQTIGKMLGHPLDSTPLSQQELRFLRGAYSAIRDGEAEPKNYYTLNDKEQKKGESVLERRAKKRAKEKAEEEEKEKDELKSVAKEKEFKLAIIKEIKGRNPKLSDAVLAEKDIDELIVINDDLKEKI